MSDVHYFFPPAAAYPLITLFCIVVTANHYILDAVGGAVVFGVGYLLAKTFTARMDARFPAARPAAV